MHTTETLPLVRNTVRKRKLTRFRYTLDSNSSLPFHVLFAHEI